MAFLTKTTEIIAGIRNFPLRNYIQKIYYEKQNSYISKKYFLGEEVKTFLIFSFKTFLIWLKIGNNNNYWEKILKTILPKAIEINNNCTNTEYVIRRRLKDYLKSD